LIVLTIGKFESIHLGHRALLTEVVTEAHKLGLQSAAMVFTPHPYIFFGDSNYAPMFTESERNELIERIGISTILSPSFDEKFVKMLAEEFCKMLFVQYNAKVVIVGEDYRFGKERAGNVERLKQEAQKYGANVKVMPAVHGLKDAEISTSNIRKLLTEGNMADANRQLGFSFFISGVVTHGKQLGRTIGFPTLNIYPDSNKLLPPDGVYSTQTTVNGTVYNSITNIGLRPTVEDDTKKVRSVETHLFEYSGNEIYGAHVKIELLDFIRPERKFSSLDELKTQIAKDSNYASDISKSTIPSLKPFS